jgi:hypothetical protein
MPKANGQQPNANGQNVAAPTLERPNELKYAANIFNV